MAPNGLSCAKAAVAMARSHRTIVRAFSLSRAVMSKIVAIPVPGSNKTISVNTGLFINNEFVPSSNGQENIVFVHRIIIHYCDFMKHIFTLIAL